MPTLKIVPIPMPWIKYSVCAAQSAPDGRERLGEHLPGTAA